MDSKVMNTELENTGLPPKIITIKADGIMWIGDPHLTCVTPGRRIEDDFLSVSLNKLRQAREIAERDNLVMICAGDLLDNATEKKAGTSKVVENINLILSGFAKAVNFRPFITLTGNHDKNEVTLTPGSTLSTMHDVGLVNVIQNNGAFAVVEVGDQCIGLGGTDYGKPIPKDVRGFFDSYEKKIDKVIWFTHSQFEFDEVNPFLEKIFEIKGCDMVINGHDHTKMTPKWAGNTCWHNPGNLTRMSVDCSSHKPAVWEWNPSVPDGQLKEHAIKHNELAFDMTGLRIAADVDAAKKFEAERSKSLFAELLLADKGSEMDRTVGGEVIEVDLERYIQDNPKMSEGAQTMLRNLLKRAPEKLKI